MILDEKLATGELILLDGGIGSEIERLGGEMHTNAWCGVANKTHPDTVRHVHESYLKAGSDVITANTFATCRHVLEAAGCGDETVAINQRAVELAREALEIVSPDKPIAIAGSISNHVAWESGTVAGDPATLPSPQQEADNYQEWVEILADAGCDLLILEMMQDLHHSTRLIEAAKSTGLPIWVGISASRGPDGQMIGWHMASEEAPRVPDDFPQTLTEPLEVIIDTLTEYEPDVVGIMHSSFYSTTPAIEMLFERWDGPVMTYPEANGYDAVARAPMSVTPDDFAAYCRQWVENGVQIVGGCCGTTIHHIRAMVDQLPKHPGPRPTPQSVNA